MRILSGVLALVTIALAACAPRMATQGTETTEILRAWGSKPNSPKVEVVNDAVVIVDQEPIFIPGNYVDKKITWEIVPANSKYKFESVRVENEAATNAQAFTDCAVIADGKKAKCENNGTPGKYKYTIKVTGPATVPELDPWIWNGR